MLLLHTALVLHAVAGAAFVKESAQAVKDIKEGEVTMTCRGTEGTVECRMLVSERDEAFRMSFLKEGKPYADLALVDGQGTVVDYEGRTVQLGLDLKAVAKNAEATRQQDAKVEIADGNVSINLDSSEGLIVRANPGMENVRKWTAGDDELFTGEFGKGAGKRGTFQWVRDVKTKLPKSFDGFMDDHPIDINFAYRARRLHLGDFRIPASAYEGFARANTLPSNVKVGG